MPIGKNSRIRLHGDIALRIIGTSLQLRRGDEELLADAALFPIMGVFQDFTALEDGFALVSKQAAEAGFNAIAALTLLRALLAKGFLESEDEAEVRIGGDHAEFDSLPVHIRMLGDIARTSGYQQALAAVIGPDDVVLDIGTGSGVLAASAAKLGAAHVYAVERTRMGAVAEDVFRANGLADRITLVHGDAVEVTLPQKASVLVSELIGNDPFDENVVSLYADARARHLLPGARVIPRALECWLMPVELPQTALSKYRVTDALLADWQRSYGLDFTPLAALEGGPMLQRTMFTGQKHHSSWKQLGQPVRAGHVALGQEGGLAIEALCRFTADQPGSCNAIVLYHRINLHGDIWIEGHPALVDADYHWSHFAYLMPSPVTLKAGQVLELDYELRDRQSTLRLR